MADNDTVLEVGALVDLGQFSPGVAQMASETKAATGEMNTDFDRAASGAARLGYSMTEARHGIVGFGEEIGVRVPRVISTFLASIAPIGGAMAAAFSTVAIIGIGQLLVGVIGKLDDLSEAAQKTRTEIAGFDREMNASTEALDQVNEKTAELAGGPLAQLAAEMAYAGDKTLDLTKFMEELNKRLADQPGFWSKLGSAVGGVAVDAWHLFDDAADEAARTSKHFNVELANSVKQSRDLSAAIDLMAGHIKDLQSQKENVNLAAFTEGQDKSFAEQIKTNQQALNALKEMQEKFDVEKFNEANEASQKLLSEQEKAQLKSIELEIARITLLQKLGKQSEEETRASLLRQEDARYAIVSAGLARQREATEQQAALKPKVDFSNARKGEDAQAEALYEEHEKKRFDISSETDEQILARDRQLVTSRVAGAKEVADALASAATQEAEREFQAREISAERETQVLREQALKRQQAERDVLQEKLKQATDQGEKGAPAKAEVEEKLRANMIADQAELDKIDADGVKNSEQRFTESVDKKLALARESISTQVRLVTEAIAAYAAAYGKDGEEYEKLIDKKNELTLKQTDAQREVNSIQEEEAQAHQRTLLEIERASIEARQSAGLLSPDAAADQLAAVNQKELALEREALLQKQALWGQETAEYARITKELAALNDQGLRTQAEDEDRLLRERSARWKSFSDEIAGDFAQSITQILEKTRTVRQSMEELGSKIAVEFIQNVIKMTVQHGIQELIMLAQTVQGQTAQTAATTAGVTARTAAQTTGFLPTVLRVIDAITGAHLIGEAKKTTATVAGQTAQTAAVTTGQTAQTAAATLGNAAKIASTVTTNDAIVTSESGAAGAAAFASVMESLPFPVNIATAPEVMAGVIAAVLANLSTASAAGGFDVPHDMMALVHKDEKVLPARTSQGIDRIIDDQRQGSVGGGRGVNVTFAPTVSAYNAKGISGELANQQGEFLKMIHRMTRYGAIG